jgi:hypothetical protein
MHNFWKQAVDKENATRENWHSTFYNAGDQATKHESFGYEAPHLYHNARKMHGGPKWEEFRPGGIVQTPVCLFSRARDIDPEQKAWLPRPGDNSNRGWGKPSFFSLRKSEKVLPKPSSASAYTGTAGRYVNGRLYSTLAYPQLMDKNVHPNSEVFRHTL